MEAVEAWQGDPEAGPRGGRRQAETHRGAVYPVRWRHHREDQPLPARGRQEPAPSPPPPPPPPPPIGRSHIGHHRLRDRTASQHEIIGFEGSPYSPPPPTSQFCIFCISSSSPPPPMWFLNRSRDGVAILKVSQPKMWHSSSGALVQVETADTERFRDIRLVYEAICSATLTEHRTAALAHLKQMVIPPAPILPAPLSHSSVSVPNARVRAATRARAIYRLSLQFPMLTFNWFPFVDSVRREGGGRRFRPFPSSTVIDGSHRWHEANAALSDRSGSYEVRQDRLPSRHYSTDECWADSRHSAALVVPQSPVRWRWSSAGRWSHRITAALWREKWASPDTATPDREIGWNWKIWIDWNGG